MKKAIIAILIILGLAIGLDLAVEAKTEKAEDIALTDWGCMSDCQRQGYMYGLCKRQCSW